MINFVYLYGIENEVKRPVLNFVKPRELGHLITDLFTFLGACNLVFQR